MMHQVPCGRFPALQYVVFRTYGVHMYVHNVQSTYVPTYPYSVLRTLRRMPILRCDLSEIGHVKRALGANLDLRLMRRGSALRPSLCRLRTQVHTRNILRTTVLPILLSTEYVYLTDHLLRHHGIFIFRTFILPGPW